MVIIPTFNRFKYLLNTIDSVKKQTYNNLEIIVVNDCSTDFTESLAALEKARSQEEVGPLKNAFQILEEHIEEENRAVSRIFAEPSTFVLKVSSGSSYDFLTKACAARWNTYSGLNSEKT